MVLLGHLGNLLDMARDLRAGRALFAQGCRNVADPAHYLPGTVLDRPHRL
ncbi:MAG: hypothetical protein ACD_10C00091G0001, partial [uncultured bacterium]